MHPAACIREHRGTRLAVHCRDCLEGMSSLIEPGSVDVVVTSPPYNLGTQYGRYDDTISRAEYLAWMDRWAAEVRRVLHDRGSLFLNLGAKPSDPWGPFEVVLALRRHFALQNVIHWVKSISIARDDAGRYPGITRNVSVGHYKPINSPRYLNDCHEYIFHLTKAGDVELDRLAIGVEYQDKSNVARWGAAAADRRCRGNTWFVPYRTIRSRDRQRPHPASFPARIPRMCIELHGLSRTRLVLDPFLGIGNSAVACVELGTGFVGFEIDPEYWTESARALDRAIAAAAGDGGDAPGDPAEE